MTPRTRLLLLALCLAAPACRATASVDARAQLAAQRAAQEDQGPPRETLMDTSAGNVAMLGARHDLGLASGGSACTCLRAAVGQPGDASFKWEGLPPTTDPGEQQVVAFSAEGVACSVPQAATLTGPSYWGYQVDGEDVIVTIEAASEGRPQTFGAIVPKPTGSGKTYLQARGKSPYGRGTGSDGLCRIGN